MASWESAPAGVDAGAEAGDREWRTRSVTAAVGIDIGDQQAGGVGADVDDGDAHARDGRGCVGT